MTTERPNNLQQLMLRYGESVRGFFRQRFRNNETVEDCVQETFLKIHAATTIENLNSPRAYLFTTARNVAADQFRRRDPIAVYQTDDDIDIDQLIDESPTPEDRLSASWEASQLRQTIAGLPFQCRQVMILRYYRGLAHKEIARQLEISPKTVEKHIARGLLSCKTALVEPDLKVVDLETARKRHHSGVRHG